LPEAPTPQPSEKDAVTIRNTPIHILKDQAAIWTSPLHIRAHDLEWLLPLAAATGVGIATDHHVMSSVVSQDPNFNQNNIDASNVLLGGFIAAPVALYGFGHFKDDEHAREAGILGGEALVDGVVVEQAMKLIFWRERPAVNNAHGLFFQSDAGVDSSFPSAHSALAWSSAAVIAGEYPSRWTQFGVYTLATGVSLTRVLGQQHFPTDVLVGSAVGWLVGHYVYRAHHKPSATARR
jgi:PAP2 superfamily